MVKLWSAREGRCLATLEGHVGEVRSVAWSAEGETLASVCAPILSSCEVGALLGTNLEIRSPYRVYRLTTWRDELFRLWWCGSWNLGLGRLNRLTWIWRCLARFYRGVGFGTSHAEVTEKSAEHLFASIA